ncbi:MAG TPA: ACP S-malonyltransferase, partial [Mycobacterium sp.]|nr:ACP S-malonyltransferase [Mycobacterium sp.]
MLAEWLTLPGAAERVAAWSEISGLDLARLGTTATAEEITDTAVTQPLVVAAGSLAALSKLAEDPPAKARVRPLATAGAFHTQYMASALDGYAAAAK